MKTVSFLRRYHWKALLLRILINAIVLAMTVLVIPGIHFVDPSLLSIMFMAVILGALNALVKPVLQFALLPFIFASYGLVIVLVNALLLLLLAWLFPGYFAVERLLWAFAGGALIGLLGTFLENLCGLIPPILPDEATGLRRRFEDQPVGSLGGMPAAGPLSEEEQLVIETLGDDGQLIQPELESQVPGVVGVAETSAPTAPPPESNLSQVSGSHTASESTIKEEGEA
jgi:putative membrane protein